MCRGPIEVCGIAGEKKMVELWKTKEQMENMTVKQVKVKLQKAFPNIPGQGELKLCVRGRTLDESTLMSKYKIQSSTVIHLVLRVHGA